MTAAFEPVGEVARWKLIYDNVHLMPVGTLITFDDLKALGIDARRDTSAIGRCREELLTKDLRWLKSERGVGYRIAAATEQLGEARRKQKSGHRRLAESIEVATNVRPGEVSPAQQAQLDALAMVSGAGLAIMKRFDRRLRRVEDRTAAHDKKLEQQRTELDRMKESLAREGIEVPTPRTIKGSVVNTEQ